MSRTRKSTSPLPRRGHSRRRRSAYKYKIRSNKRSGLQTQSRRVQSAAVEKNVTLISPDWPVVKTPSGCCTHAARGSRRTSQERNRCSAGTVPKTPGASKDWHPPRDRCPTNAGEKHPHRLKLGQPCSRDIVENIKIETDGDRSAGDQLQRQSGKRGPMHAVAPRAPSRQSSRRTPG